MRTQILLRVVALSILAVSIAAMAAGQQPANTEKPLPYTSPGSGAEMYREYCASCHGIEGKGDGPAADALKAKPSDLTILARRKGGKFPGGDVYQVIKWGGGIVGHGSKEMPVWGRAFLTVSGRREELADQRIKNLVRYLESIQVK